MPGAVVVAAAAPLLVRPVLIATVEAVVTLIECAPAYPRTTDHAGREVPLNWPTKAAPEFSTLGSAAANRSFVVGGVRVGDGVGVGVGVNVGGSVGVGVGEP